MSDATTTSPLSAEAAKVAAHAADERAKTAKRAAEAAASAAKDARRAASKASAEAEDFREAATPPEQKDGHPKPSADQAKQHLLDAIRQFDPLDVARKNPWTTVGVAVGAGVVLGGSGVAVISFSRLAMSLFKVARPLMAIAGEFMASKAAADAVAGATGAEPTVSADAASPASDFAGDPVAD